MIFSLQMPRMGDQMACGIVEKLYVAEGSEIQPGARLLDVRVDLSSVAPQDCPPDYAFRMVSRERGWVRQVTVSVGDVREVGAVVALISTDPHEPLTNPPMRVLRVATAGILGDSGWFSNRPSS